MDSENYFNHRKEKYMRTFECFAYAKFSGVFMLLSLAEIYICDGSGFFALIGKIVFWLCLVCTIMFIVLGIYYGMKFRCKNCGKFDGLKESSIDETHSSKTSKYTTTESKEVGNIYHSGSIFPDGKIYQNYDVEHAMRCEDITYNCVCKRCGAAQKVRIQENKTLY